LKEVFEKIAGEIKTRGIIPFSRFMELALYCPNFGYYEREEDKIGRAGDFFTSVSVGPLFGELLAFQFAEWLSERNPASTLQIVEAGAHRGDLSRDILSWLKLNRPQIHERLEYVIIEFSDRRREWQKKFLEEFSDNVRWVQKPADLENVNGIIFSNELLDAFPVSRFQWDVGQAKWFELGVKLSNQAPSWQTLREVTLPEVETYTGQSLPESLLKALPHGFILDLAPTTRKWWAEAAAGLQSGFLLTIDYGLAFDELLLPHRKSGTLRAYHHHKVNDDLLANPGEQDLTAHVDFTALQIAGERAGLQTHFFGTQSQFSAAIASKIFSDHSAIAWNPQQVRQFQTLTHPEHLGERFRVLVQRRNAKIN
jgi:SAM-dependent MidA family methyltransferase